MTNAQIIAVEQVRLAQEGILKYTGRKIQVFNLVTQEEEFIDEIQPIHTFNAWKSLGYKVKKGEKAIAKFPIWKYVTKVSKELAEAVDETDTDHIEGRGKMYMKTSAFFSDEQVEKIEEEV